MNARRLLLPISIFALLALFQMSFASGYGTSKITLSKSSLSISPGSSASVSYNVTIQSGNTWGTILHVVNQAQLTSQGINVTLSNAGGAATDPPFSGTMTVSLMPSVKPGNYSITLNATMDDPTTNNTVLSLMVPAVVPNPIASGGTTGTTTPATTTAYNSGSGAGSGTSLSYAGLNFSNITTWLLIGIVIVAISGIAAMLKKAKARLMVLGITLILIGILLWLYGDYSGGITSYIYGGVAAIVIGTLLWLYADVKWGMFAKKNKSTYLIILSVILLLAGTATWLYGDLYNGGNLTDVWGGVIVMLIGIVLWTLAYHV